MISHLVFYIFVAILALGAWGEWTDRPKRHAVNIGRSKARRQKYIRGVVAQCETAAVESITVKRMTRRPDPKSAIPVQSLLVDQVVSALFNLQYKKKDARAAAQRATGEDFDSRLKFALALLRAPEAKIATPQRAG
jgi:hypothetical protein